MTIRLHNMHVFAGLVAFLALPACAQLGAKSRVDPATIAVYPGGEDRVSADSQREADKSDGSPCKLLRGMGGYSRGAIDLDCFQFPEDSDEPVSAMGTTLLCRPIRGEDGKVREGLSCEPVVETREGPARLDRSKLAYSKAAKDKTSRNRLTALLMKHSDDICTRELGMLTSNQATTNAALNTLATAATTTANIVTGEQAKSILTGIGTFSGATRSHLNADVYRNTVAYAISRAITLERKRLRDAIEARYDHLPANFTVDDAIRAANEYHGICSFYKGLELVLASVEGDQRTRDAEARRAQIDELEERIRKYREQRSVLKTGSPDIALYDANIAELMDRVQDLTLAAVPARSVTPTPEGNKPPTAPPVGDPPTPLTNEDRSSVDSGS